MLDDFFVWLVLAFLVFVGGISGLGWVSCSIIPKGVTSRGALLTCGFDIHHGGLLYGTFTH